MAFNWRIQGAMYAVIDSSGYPIFREQDHLNVYLYSSKDLKLVFMCSRKAYVAVERRISLPGKLLLGKFYIIYV